MQIIDIYNYPVDPMTEIHDPEGKLLVTTNNELQVNWILCQIKDKQLSGYYIIYEGNKYLIGSDGIIEGINLFENVDILVRHLMDIGESDYIELKNKLLGSEIK